MADPKLKIVIEVDGKQYAAELDNLDKKTGRFGETAKNSAAGINHLKGAVGLLGGAFAALRVIDLAKFVASTSAEFERLQTTLAAVEGSSDKAKKVFADLEALAATTPFQLQQMTDGYIKLKTFGLDPLDGTYQAIIDQSAKLGSSQQTLEGIILALGQAWAKQKLQGEEIMQLVERGVPVWALLEKATGKNTIELQKLSEQGKLGKDVMKQFIAEMGQQSLGAAAAQVNTLNGSFSNLRDSISRAAMALGEKSGFNAFLKDAAQSATSFFDSFTSGDKQRALDIFKAQIEPNIEYLKSLGWYMKNLDATNLDQMNRMLETAKLQGVDLGKQAPFSTMLTQVEALRSQYDGLAQAKEKVSASSGPESVAAKMIGDQMVRLDARIKSIITGYNDLATANPKAIAAPSTSSPTSPRDSRRDLETAEEYGNRMYELARQAYPEATQSAEEYGEAMAKLVVEQTKAIDDAYLGRLTAAEQATLDARTATEVFTDEMIRLNAQWLAGDIGTETYTSRIGAARQAMDGFGKSGKDSMDELIAATKGWGDQFTNTMADAVMKGKLSFKDLANSIIADLLRISIYEGITAPLMQYFGLPGSAANAKGNIFNNGDIVPFATGGVVSSPTLFPMRGGRAGLMGEAGPEAIMPLTRTSNGKLGVQATGGSTDVRVILENRGAPKEAQQAQVNFDTKGMILTVMIDDLRRGGGYSTEFARRHNLTRGAN